MARPAFKRWWTRIVPESIERSTYVLAATLALALLLWQWRPIAEPVIWTVEQRAAVLGMQLVFWLGWSVLLVSTFLLNHFEVFGLRQVFARLRCRGVPASEFRTPLFYRHVRHPIYLGFLLAYRLHFHRHLFRGARPDRAIRRPLPRLPRSGRDVGALAAQGTAMS